MSSCVLIDVSIVRLLWASDYAVIRHFPSKEAFTPIAGHRLPYIVGHGRPTLYVKRWRKYRSLMYPLVVVFLVRKETRRAGSASEL